MRKLFSAVRRWFGVSEPKAVYHPWKLRPEIDLFTFREDDDNVARMRRLFQDDFFQQVLMVLHNSRPRGYPTRGQVFDSLALGVELGRIEGFESVLTLMELMTKSNPKQEELRATWGNPDEPDSQTESTG